MHAILTSVETQHPYHPSPKRTSSLVKLALSWAVAIAIAIGLQQFVFQSYQVFGQSMEPTLSEGDYLIISKVGPSWSQLRGNTYQPERNDIVVIEANGTRLIKRIIGLPGDTVLIENGALTIRNQDQPNGFNPYAELDLPAVNVSGQLQVSVPEGEVFVVGDNREGGNSLDSRNQLGTIPSENIVGSLVLRLWPTGAAQTF